jgi:lysophospholipase L1-like esterase
VFAVLVSALAVVSSRATGAAPNTYVALGDSYTSAPFIAAPAGQPLDCGRSDRNYPHIVQATLRYPVFRDVSCGSADTKDMTQAQGPLPLGNFNPPQLDALSPEVALVTIGIGGNDVGFGGATSECVQLPKPLGGRPCHVHYTQGGVDQISQRIADAGPKIAAVLDEIHVRAPQAKVVVVGYPALFPETNWGCYPYVPVLRDDIAWLRAKNKELNAMLATEAANDGSIYADWYGPSIGHDMCKPPGVAWTNAVAVVPPSYPAHPNMLGTQGAANAVLRALGHPVTLLSGTLNQPVLGQTLPRLTG